MNNNIYIIKINNFWKLNENQKFKTSTISLYFYLLRRWQENDFKSFKLSERDIIKCIKLNRLTIRTEKQFLRNLGLIQYQQSKGKSTLFNISEMIDEAPLSISSVKTEQPKDIEIVEQLKSTEIVEQLKNTEIVEQQKGTENPKKENSSPKNKDIPTEKEFLEYAKTLEIYTSNMDFRIKAKYEAWISNGWKNGHGKPIKKWKISLKNTMPYWISTNPSKDLRLPTINIPKNTYNE